MNCEHCDTVATHAGKVKSDVNIKPEWRCPEHAEEYHVDLRQFPKRVLEGFFIEEEKEDGVPKL